MGCIFAGRKDSVGWESFSCSIEECITWLQKLCLLMRAEHPRLELTNVERPDQDIDLQYGMKYGPSSFRYLCAAAQRFRDSDNLDKKVARQLVALGTRQSSFWSLPRQPPPMFGISALSTLLPLLEASWMRVDLLRNFSARTLPKYSQDYIVRYRERGWLPYEFATALPTKEVFGDLSLREVMHYGPRQWSISDRSILVEEPTENLEDHRSPSGTAADATPLPSTTWPGFNGSVVLGKTSRTKQKHTRWLLVTREQVKEISKNLEGFFKTYESLYKRMKSILENGESCFAAMQVNGNSQVHMDILFGTGKDFVRSAESLESRSRRPFEKSNTQNVFRAELQVLVGSEDLAALFALNKESKTIELLDYVSLQELDHFLILERTARRNEMDVQSAQKLRVLGSSNRVSAAQAEIDLIEACEGASKIYKILSRSQTFACILMFDSGCNLDPYISSDVMAISSGSSLYIAGSLLCDPFEEPGATEI